MFASARARSWPTGRPSGLTASRAARGRTSSTWRQMAVFRARRDSGAEGPASRVQGPGSRVQGPGSRVQSRESRVQSPAALDPGPWTLDLGPYFFLKYVLRVVRRTSESPSRNHDVVDVTDPFVLSMVSMTSVSPFHDARALASPLRV